MNKIFCKIGLLIACATILVSCGGTGNNNSSTSGNNSSSVVSTDSSEFSSISEAVNYVTIKYDANGGKFDDGSEFKELEVEKGSLLTAPTVPSRTGYSFAGWSQSKNSTNLWKFETDVIETNMTLYATWNEENTITDYSYFEFAEVENGYSIKLKIMPENGIVNIPNAYKEKPIIEIGMGGFSGYKNILKVGIPNSITRIGSYAFDKCSSLTSIVIPNSVKRIGSEAFNNCSSLTIYCEASSEPSEWVLSWNPLMRPVYWKINETNYLKQDGLIYVVEDGNAIVTRYESNIKNVIITSQIVIKGIEYNITRIGRCAFERCISLTSILIPDSVTSIGYFAFSGCSSLAKIVVDINNKYLDSRDNCNAIIDKDTNKLIQGCKTTIIPDSVTSIGSYAFYGCRSLTSILIPDSVTSIAFAAFYGCNSLTSIVIPNSVTSIDDYGFSNCISLTSIVISGSVTSIESYVFAGCRSLTSILIPDGVTSIESYVFSGCSSLTSIVIPDSVTSIAVSAFSGCSSLQYNEYGNCLYLGNEENPYLVLVKAKDTSITDATISNNTRLIMISAFSGCSSLTSIVIPNSVTSIESDVFSGCSSLTSIVIPDSVTSIAVSAFSGCSSLQYNEYGNCLYLGNEENPYLVLVKAKDTSITDATISNNTRFIMDFAFSGCSSLISIEIPNSVTSIGYSAFNNCSSLTIYCEASSKPSGWKSNWNSSNRPVYWAGQWSYVDGVPTPNN